MDLYLLRHGKAEPRSPSVAEAARALTAKGRKDIRRIMEFARRAKIKPQVILTSPYTRARQTAEIAAKELGGVEIRESRSLLPNAKPEALWKELAEWDDASRVLLTGHEPHLSNLLRFLLGGANVEIKKGALLCVQVANAASPEGTLRCLIAPGHLRG